jgi:hypothetical protein
MTKKVSTAVTKSDAGYLDLTADLLHPGCPVCRGADRAAWGLIDAILWEFVNDPGTRLNLRASHGLCRDHLYMAAGVASSQAGGLGMAILLEDFLAHIAEEASQLADDRRGSRRRRRQHDLALAPQGTCTACVSAGRVSYNYLRLLSMTEPDDDLGVAVAEPQRGLCVPHLARGLRWFRGADEGRRLLSHFLPGIEELRSELTGYVRKHDYQRRNEGMTEQERTAWPRAVARLVGAPPSSRPPRR